MEENCLASSAYRIRRENPDFSLETRRLLRFNSKYCLNMFIHSNIKPFKNYLYNFSHMFSLNKNKYNL